MRQSAERRLKPDIFQAKLYTGEQIGVLAQDSPGVALDSTRLSTGGFISEKLDSHEPKIPVRAWKMIGIPADGDHLETIVIRAETKNRPLIRRISKYDFLQWPQVMEVEIDGKPTHYVERQIKNITLGSQCVWSKTGKKENERIWQVLGAAQGNKLFVETVLDPHEYAAIDIAEFEKQETPKMIKIEKPIKVEAGKNNDENRERVERMVKRLKKEVADITYNVQDFIAQEPKTEAVLSAMYLLDQERERILDHTMELKSLGNFVSEEATLKKLEKECETKGSVPLFDFIENNIKRSIESYTEHGNRALDEKSYINRDEQDALNDLLWAMTLFKDLKNSDSAEFEALEEQTIKLLQGKFKFYKPRFSSLENGQAISREAFEVMKSENHDRIRAAYIKAKSFLNAIDFLGVPVHKTQLDKYFDLRRGLSMACSQLQRKGANQKLRVKREEMELRQ